MPDFSEDSLDRRVPGRSLVIASSASGDREGSGAGGDRGAGESVGVAMAIPAFVVGADDADPFAFEQVDLAQKLGADERMLISAHINSL